MAQTVPATVILGPGKTGLAIGYRILTLARATHSAFTTTNVAETSTLGTYAVSGGVSVPDEGGYIIWGVAGTDYAEGNIEPIITATAIATAVWAAGTRTLTSFGTLVADVWAHVSRTITGGGGSASDIWAYASRTLTQTAAEVVDAISGSNLNIVRAATFGATLTGLSISSTWTAVYFTVKSRLGSPDSTALIQMRESNPFSGDDGLLVLNHGEAEDATWGSLTVDRIAGTVTIVLSDDATALLRPDSYDYDLKVLLSDDSSIVLTQAVVSVSLTSTETIQ